RLADAECERMLYRPAGRGASALVVAQEAHEIAGGGETQALHLGLGALIGELVDEARLGLAVRELDRLAIDGAPGDVLRLVSLALAHRQLGAVVARHLVGELERFERATARARHELVAHRLDDRLAAVGGDGSGEAKAEIGARRIGIPARPDNGPAAPQRK